MEWWKQIGSTGEVRRKGKNTLFHFLSFRWKGLKFFLLSCDVSWQDAEGCAVDKYLYFILYIFPISDSPKVSLIENIPHLQIYKSCTVGHVYQSDYSNADWINRISMAAKSNTLIQFADICQLHGACLNWESNPFFFLQKIPQQDLDLYYLVSMSEQLYFGTLASSISGFWRFQTLLVVLHTLPHTHMFKNYTEITGRSPNNSPGQFTQNVCWPPSLAPASS